MIMCTYKKICITNRHLVQGDFFKKIDDAARSADMIILREKDLSETEYEKLAKDVIAICDSHGKLCILHNFPQAAVRLGHPYIHLPLNILTALEGNDKKFFRMIGASAHSLEEAKIAASLGADYITASHIFATDCKKDVPARGLGFLKNVCSAVDIPVYALGGIKPDNIEICISCGASGICMMSYFMK